jgi:hypothetical protein
MFSAQISPLASDQPGVFLFQFSPKKTISAKKPVQPKNRFSQKSRFSL